MATPSATTFIEEQVEVESPLQLALEVNPAAIGLDRGLLGGLSASRREYARERCHLATVRPVTASGAAAQLGPRGVPADRPSSSEVWHEATLDYPGAEPPAGRLAA